MKKQNSFYQQTAVWQEFLNRPDVTDDFSGLKNIRKYGKNILEGRK